MPYSHLWKLLVYLSAVSTDVVAPAEAPSGHDERELPVSADNREEPLVLYGKVNVPIMLIVDATVRREEVHSPPGLEVRPHPFQDDAVLVTLAPALGALKSVVFSVPLEGGKVLTFTVVPARGKADVLVRARRVPPSSEREVQAQRERDELRAMLVHAVGAKDCAPTAAEGVGTPPDTGIICKRAGDRAFVRMKARCPGATIRMVAPPEGGLSLDFEETECTPEDGVCTATLVVRRQGVEPRGATIELRSQDGGLCRSHTLQPW